MRKVNKELQKIYGEYAPLSNYAFSLYLFISRLYDRCIADGIQELFFLSREGKFLKKLFDRYVELKGDTYPIPTSYLLVSRKSIMLSSLNDLGKEKFTELQVYGRMSICKFLKALYFQDKEIQDVLLELRVDGEAEIENFFESEAFQKVKASRYVQSLYTQKRETAIQSVQRYLEGAGFLTEKKIGLVDVGWNGTIQNCLEKHRKEKKTVGYYIGIYEGSPFREIEKYGLLFDSKSVFSKFNYNYEYICVADHGTVASYDEFGTPVLEADNDIILYTSYFSKIQETIMCKFEALYGALPSGAQTDEYSGLFAKMHARMLISFKKEERRILQTAREAKQDGLAAIAFRRTLKTYLAVAYHYLLLALHAI